MRTQISFVKLDFVKELATVKRTEYQFKYSICTLVTRVAEYEEMVASFVRGGFSPDCCEYLFINNSTENRVDAYKGYNLFLQTARGEYVIICHQDIVLLEDGIQQLDQRIKELNLLDPSWAVLGNAGVTKLNHPAIHITHPLPEGENRAGDLPAKVHSLDENFILVKNSANLCVSHDLSGFHLYGTDLCRVARVVGRTCWAVDFNLLHKGLGKLDFSFFELCGQLENKHLATSREGLVTTTCTFLLFSNSRFEQRKTQFMRIYLSRDKPQISEAFRAQLIKAFGFRSYFFYWLLLKMRRPFENLAHHVRKYYLKNT